METEKHYFTNSEGRKLELVTVSPWLLDSIAVNLERKWRETGKSRPTPPTYEVPTLTGAMEVHEHNPDTLETVEEKAAWAAYQANVKEWNNDYLKAQIRIIAHEGVVITDDLTAWRIRMAFLGVEVPADAGEAKVFYVQTEYLKTNQDTHRLKNLAYSLVTLTPEALRIAEDAFRRALASAGRDTPTGTPAQPEGRLVLQQSNGGSTRGAGARQVEKPVGQRERV